MVRLAWVDVGADWLFGRGRIDSAADLAARTHFSWDADPVGDAFLKKLGSAGRPLAPPDILPALQRDMIDALLGSPLTVLAMQLYTAMHFVSTQPVRYEVGAFVVRKATWDQLAPATQKVLREEGARLGERIQKQERADDAKAMRMMIEAGLIPVEVPRAALAKAASESAAALDGKAWSRAWRLRVERAAADVRKRHSQ